MNKEMEESVKDVVHQYLKDNLELVVWTEKHYGEYGGADGVKVTVTLRIDGEEIASSYDYTGL